MSNLRYRPDIDGLRTIAVVPVVLFHLNDALAPGGFVGVDIFFVISGYLITRIIQGDIEANRFSLISFYERRARRILPALFAVILFCLVVGWFWFMPFDYDTMAKSAIATIFFASNIRFMFSFGDYFAPSTEVEPLLHTWSLAVEEQFYIVWPVLLWLVARFVLGNRHRNAVAAIALMSIASFLVSVWLLPRDATAAFYLPFTRVWELGLGALLALGGVPALRGRLAPPLVAAIGLLLILIAIVAYSDTTPFPGVAALLPCLGSAMIIWAGESGSGSGPVGRLLGTRPMIFIGKLSYSLYLWHWPVIVFLHYRYDVESWPTWWPAPLFVALVAISWLSLKLIEAPFRSSATIGRGPLFTAAAAGAALLAGAALFVIRDQGVYDRLPPRVAAIARGVIDDNPDRARCMNRGLDGDFCVIGAKGVEPDFLLWGDSHSNAVQPGVAAAAERAGRAGYVSSRPACVPFLKVSIHNKGKCRQQNAAVERLLAARPGIRDVILVGRWAYYLSGDAVGQEIERNMRLTDWTRPEPREPNADSYRRGQARTVDWLRASGRNILVIDTVPEIGWSVPQYAALAALADRPLPTTPTLSDMRERNAAARALWDRYAARGEVTLLPVDSIMCRPDCALVVDGVAAYMDDDHLTATAARAIFTLPVGEWLARAGAPAGTAAAPGGA